MDSLEAKIAKLVSDATSSLQAKLEGLELEAAKVRKLESKIAELEEKASRVDKLEQRIVQLERTVEEGEQYSRKADLILSGDGLPLPREGSFETPEQSRVIASSIIKDKLGVELKGTIAACHRLKNKKRMLVRFVDLDDRNAVYQARFQSVDDRSKVIIHENLTQPRAAMVRFLGQLRKDNRIKNYYTRNGSIYARDSDCKKYELIEPWMSEEQVLRVCADADAKQTPNTNESHDPLMRSQSLRDLPPGHVASRTANLSDYVVSSGRRTRQRGRY